MSDARVLGMPAEWTFEGRTYKVAPRSFAHEAAFRRWLEREALMGIQRHKDLLSELEYQQMLAGWRHDCTTGVYAYPMPLCIQGLMSIGGAKYITFLSLKEHNPEVTEELVERIFDDEGILNPAWKEGQTEPVPKYLVEPAWEQLRLLRQGLDDPNRQKPAPKEAAPAAS